MLVLCKKTAYLSILTDKIFLVTGRQAPFRDLDLAPINLLPKVEMLEPTLLGR